LPQEQQSSRNAGSARVNVAPAARRPHRGRISADSLR
jgi:hypothetical protein